MWLVGELPLEVCRAPNKSALPLRPRYWAARGREWPRDTHQRHHFVLADVTGALRGIATMCTVHNVKLKRVRTKEKETVKSSTPLYNQNGKKHISGAVLATDHPAFPSRWPAFGCITYLPSSQSFDKFQRGVPGVGSHLLDCRSHVFRTRPAA